MNLYEVEGKQLFRSAGIPVPEGQVVTRPEEAAEVAQRLGGGAAVKAQVRSGHRGQQGAVRLVHSPEEARQAAEAILAMDLDGERPAGVLVEALLEIRQELYVALTINSRSGSGLLMFSHRGGMSIEEIAATDPEALATLELDGLRVPRQHEFVAMFTPAQREALGRALPRVTAILQKVVRAAYDLDALTLEINPLVVTGDRRVVAADAKVVLDEEAAFRHDYGLDLLPRPSLGELEQRARDAGLSYVPLGTGGNVGIIAGGAGLAMATMDIIKAYGGRPANFLDTGGGVTEEQMAEALRIVLAAPGIEGIIVNVFGGINNCAVMARGLARVLSEGSLDIPLVVKMRGHSQDEGWATLESFGVPLVRHGTTDEAARLLLERMEVVA